MLKKTISWGLLAATAAGLTGCVTEIESGDDDSWQSVEQRLSTFDGWDAAKYWSPGEEVNICFEGGYSRAGNVNALFATLNQNQWGSLRLVNKGLCPNKVPTGWVGVYIAKRTDQKLSSAVGVGQWGKWRTLPVPYIRKLASKYCDEVSNAFSYSSCWRQGGGDECESIPHWVTEEDKEPVCTGDAADDFERRDDMMIYLHERNHDFLHAALVHELGHVLGAAHEHLRQDGDECNGDTGTVEYLTRYDLESSMNYCRDDTRPNSDTGLTALDELGMEMLYPHSSSLELACGRGCLKTSNGVLVSDDGQIGDEWMSRGALEWWRSSDPLSWSRRDGEIASGRWLDAQVLPQGVSNVTGRARAAISGRFTYVSGVVTRDHDAWSALTMSAL